MIRNLGQVTWKVMQVLKGKRHEMERMHEDLQMFGAPSECYELAFNGWDDTVNEAIQEVLDKYSVDSVVFCTELQDRCDGYWLHKTGLDQIL